MKTIIFKTKKEMALWLLDNPDKKLKVTDGYISFHEPYPHGSPFIFEALNGVTKTLNDCWEDYFTELEIISEPVNATITSFYGSWFCPNCKHENIMTRESVKNTPGAVCCSCSKEFDINWELGS